MNKYQFANYIYEKRKLLGLSQKELASMLDVTNKSVSKWETGAAIPRTNTLVKLAEIFNVSVDELFIEENEKKAPSVNIITADSLDKLIDEKLNYEKKKRKVKTEFSKKEAKKYLSMLVLIFSVVFISTFILGTFLYKYFGFEQSSVLEILGLSLLNSVFISGIYTGIVLFAKLLKRIPFVAIVFLVVLFALTIFLILFFGMCMIIPTTVKCIQIIGEDKNG